MEGSDESYSKGHQVTTMDILGAKVTTEKGDRFVLSSLRRRMMITLFTRAMLRSGLLV